MQLLQQMAIMFMMMLVGWIAARRGILDDKISSGISSLVVNIVNPCLILNAGIGQDRENSQKLLLTVFLALGIYLMLFGFAWITPKIFHVKQEDVGTYRVMTIFSNLGFMGMPILAALYGKEAVLYASVFLFPYNLLIYTYGVLVFTGSKEGKFSVRQIFNIGLLASLVSILIYLTGLPVAAPIQGFLSSMAAMTAPLSMIVIGYSLSKIKIRELFTDRALLGFSIWKQIVIPVLIILILRIFTHDDLLTGVCFIMVATPVGSMTAMLAEQYHGDFVLASKGVALTTILSVAAIPLLGMILHI